MPLVQLIRHGESIANAGGVSKTPACIPLSELGENQAISLLQHFQSPPDLIVISSYFRTHQTAAPLRAAFPNVPVEVWDVHEFTYLEPAHYENTTETQRAPHAHDYWSREDPSYASGEGAESFANLIARVDALIDKLHSHPAPHISIFTHSFFILAVLWRQQHRDSEVNREFMRGFAEFRRNTSIENGGITLFL